MEDNSNYEIDIIDLLKKLNISISLKYSILIFISGLTLIATPGGIGTAIKSQILKKLDRYTMTWLKHPSF